LRQNAAVLLGESSVTLRDVADMTCPRSIRGISRHIFFSVIALIAASGACARAHDLDRSSRAHRLETALMSPFCPGLLLADCPSPNAARLRAQIESRFRAGESESAITRDLAARYGATILGSPPADGFGVVLWVTLPLMAAISGVVLVNVVRRSVIRSRLARPPDAPEALIRETTRLSARLDDELRDLD
jgi:cytochrome c-type biogenesis protein CcmH/NrfF